MSKYLFTSYFWAAYIIPLIFLAIDVESYGYIIHLVSFFTFLYALMLLCKNKIETRLIYNYKISNYFFVFAVLIFIQSVFVPILDLAREIYLFSSYWALWYIFKNKTIRSDTVMYWVLIAAPISMVLTSIGISPAIDNSWSSPVRLIPGVEEGWRVNFGPPGSNVHFTAVVAGLGLILSLHSLFKFGLNKKRLFMVLLMSYLVFFSGSRAVYIGVLLSFAVILYSVLVRNKKYFFNFNILILCIGLTIIFSSEILSQTLQENVENEIIASLTKSQISDPTAGRAGLWFLHASTFTSFPFGGGSDYLKSISIGDELSTGENLAASAESFFTYLIAVYGVWSLTIFGFYFFILKKLSQSNDSLKCTLFIFALISTAASSLFSGAYGLGVWLIVPLLSAKITRV